MFKRILIVCMGNICRSPAAEYLFRQRVDGRDIQLRSAGLNAVVGDPMDATVMRLLEESGIDGSPHRAHQLTPPMLHQADLVLGMEKSHVDAMAKLAPEARGKIFLLDKWVDGRDIPDPYRQPHMAFVRAHEMIRRAIDGWMAYL